MRAWGFGRVLVAILLVAGVGLVGLAVAQKAQTDYYGYFEELANVIDQIEHNYVEEVDRDKLFQGASTGMVREMDPYSDYIPRDMYRIFLEDTQGFFGGLGISIGIKDDQLTVIAPLEDTPAARAGILPGDRIVAIEGESTEGISLLEAVNKLRGEPGVEVTITIRHLGSEEEVDVTIKREVIQIHSVKGYRRLPEGKDWDYWVNPQEKIAYIRLVDFQETTVAELDEVMKKLIAEGVQGLVLDLRSNPGGLLSSAVAVADRFLPNGVIVSIRGRTVGVKEELAHKDDDYPAELLVAVLVNRFSASGSEIVAGALQDRHRAVIVGGETFGKGSVQNVIPLPDGRSGIKLTTAKYYTPSGRSIHREPRAKVGGLKPDIEVPYTTKQLQQLHQQWGDLSVEPEEGAVAEKEPFVDTQLQRAVDVLVALEVVHSVIR